MSSSPISSSTMTEWALRAAVNTTSRDAKDAGGQIDAITGTALKHVNGLDAALPSSGGPQTEAIGIAVASLALGYVAISHQVGVMKNKRLLFDQERDAGIATFTLPTDKIATDLSTAEKVMKGFIELALKNTSSSSFSSYLGIHTAEPSADSNGKFYSVLPFYAMSKALGEPLASTEPLDCQRTANNLFLKSAVPEAINAIDVGFQTDWKFIEFWASTFEGENYLNSRRAPRFIMMSLANLLWNLQHPVDTETGFPLGVIRCIAICRDVEIFLNRLIDPGSPPYLKNINNDENNLMNFMSKLETYTKTLRAAYEEEQLHQLNIDEIRNSAHSALRIMDKSVFKLIYKKYNAISKKKEPDDSAAEALADLINHLNLLLRLNPDLVGMLLPVPAWIPMAAGMNNPPQTVIDVLILFGHLSKQDREPLLHKLEKSEISSAIEFAHELRKFSNKFRKPIKEASKKELQPTLFASKYREIGILTAQRLVPFITLVIEDYGIRVDTPETYKRAKSSQENPGGTIVYSGKQQTQSINLLAQTGKGYYKWVLSPFTEGATALDVLPQFQYRMTQVTKLMDSVGELVKNYRSFLLQKSFQVFLLRCLAKVKAETADLDRNITEADKCLDHNERISRGLRDILSPMMSKLNSSLDAFAIATANFEHVVSAPDFTDEQRQLLSSKVGAIAAQFKMLFTEDSGLAALIGTDLITDTVTLAPIPVAIVPSENNTVTRPPTFVEARTVLALRKLVQCCYDALSYQSVSGRKGLLLRELLGLIEGKTNFTEAQIKHIVMDLTRVVASQRETWFFEAAYGQTRSAKALVAAIKDPGVNSVLPLAAIIFAQPAVNINQVSDTLIQQRLTSLRDGNSYWQKPSNKMWLLRSEDTVGVTSGILPA